jgi:hypothetical protein
VKKPMRKRLRKADRQGGRGERGSARSIGERMEAEFFAGNSKQKI